MKHLKFLLFPLTFAIISTIAVSAIYSQAQTPVFNSTKDAKTENDKNAINAAPVDLTDPTLTNAIDGVESGNLVRIGKALTAGSTGSKGGAYFTGYDSINFVNSTPSAKFAVTVDSQGNKAQTVDDVNVLDFNNDTMYPSPEAMPTWFNGTTNNTLLGIKSISITDTGHNGQVSPLTDIGFYCFSNTARQFSSSGHDWFGSYGAFAGLTSVTFSDYNINSPTSINIVHNGAFSASNTNARVLQTVDFGPSNQLMIFDEPTGASPLQTFGHKYTNADGDFSATSSIFGGQTALTSIDLHQSYYGDTSDAQPAVLLNIPANCFQGDTNLKSIQGNRDRLPATGNQYCNINIPSSVQTIGTNAFDGVPVQILNFPTSLKSLGNNILGANGSDALTDIIFSDSNPDASFLNNYDWGTLVPPAHTAKVICHIPYLSSYNGDFTKSPYYGPLSKSGHYTFAWNHATKLEAVSPTIGDQFMAYIRGNTARDGTFDISETPIKVIPYPENTYITGASLDFTSTANAFSITTKSEYYSHNDDDGPNSLRVNKLDWHLTSASSNIATITGKFSMIYNDPAPTLLNGTVTSNNTSSYKISLWDASATGFTFTPVSGKPAMVYTRYNNNINLGDLTTVLTYSGTGISAMNADLSILPYNNGDKTPITDTWIDFMDKGSVVNVDGQNKATVTDTSTLEYTYDSSFSPQTLCKTYQITPSATLRSDASITKINTSSDSVFPLTIWGVQKVSYEDVSTNKNFSWDGTTANSVSYPSLNPKNVYYNNIAPQTEAGVTGTIQDIKLNGATAPNPGFAYANGVVTATIPASSPDFQNNHNWTFSIQLTSGADSSIAVTIPYTFTPSVVTQIQWSSDSPGQDVSYSYDVTTKPTTATSLTWTAVSDTGSSIDATYAWNLTAMGSSASAFTTSDGTISWGGASAAAWTSTLIGEKIITVTATIIISSTPLTVSANIHLNFFSLQSVIINNASSVSFNNPIKTGGTAGTASTAYTYIPTWTTGSTGQPTIPASVVWSIATTTGDAVPSWLTIDTNGLLNYATGYTALTVKIVATVTVKATADSPTRAYTVPNASAATFTSWEVTGVTITTNPFTLDATSNTWLDVIDNGTADSTSAFVATIAGTNIPLSTVTWTLNQDTSASTANVWTQAPNILPSINSKGIISWGAGLTVGQYFFTITATSNDDSTKTATLGTFGGGGDAGLEFQIEVVDVDYSGTTVTTTNPDPTNKVFYYFQNTYETWHLKVASAAGSYDPATLCNWKITVASGETKPTWLTFSNPNGQVSADGTIDLNFGTASNPIQKDSNVDEIHITLKMYDWRSTTDARLPAVTYIVYLYAFEGNYPRISSTDWYGTNSYKYNPSKNATGNSSNPTLKFNLTNPATKNPITDAIYPHLGILYQIETSTGEHNDFTDAILAITYDNNPTSKTFGRLAWSLNTSYKSLYKYNGLYKITVTCIWLKDDASPSDFTMGSTTFNLNFQNKRPPNPYIGMGVGIGVGLAVAGGLSAFLLIRRRKIYSSIKKEEKEDITKSQTSVTGF